MSRKSELLKNVSEELPKLEIDVTAIDLDIIKNLKIKLLDTSDERHSSYTIYSMIDVLIITILAILSDCDEWTQIVMFTKKHYSWLNQFTNLDEGIPSKDTFKRIISIINPREIEPILVDVFLNIFKQYQDLFKDKSKYISEKDIWAMDGKNNNSSGRKTSKNGEIKSLQAMSLYSNNLGICLATEFIDEKTNEIPTGPKLLNLFNLENIIVAFDALNT